MDRVDPWVEERERRMATIRKIFAESEWLTAEGLNALQVNRTADTGHPAADWKRSARVFSVHYGKTEYFARYQLDSLHQPLPVIKDILAALGDVSDAWDIAAWFHFPSPWLVRRGEHGATTVAPKDVLGLEDEVVAAAAKRLSSYTA
jgi:hypothetical protein